MRRSFFYRLAWVAGAVLLAFVAYYGVGRIRAVITNIQRSKYEQRVKPELEKRSREDVAVSRTTYYVSSSGNDSNDGKSRENSWQTIEKVNRIDFRPSDEIRFEGGQTFSGTLKFDADDAGTPANPVRISSYGQGRATIDAGRGNGLLVENSMGFAISDLNIIGSGAETNEGSGIAVVNSLSGSVKLENIQIRSVGISGFGQHGIRIEGARDRSGFRRVLIEDAEIHDNVLTGINVFGLHDWKADDYAHENVIVRRVRAYRNFGRAGKLQKHSGSGIVLSDVDGGIIEHSTAFENGRNCDSLDGGPVGIWAWDANRIVIQHNESYSNQSAFKDGGGFDFDGGITNSVMQYNYSHDNAGPGYLLMQYSYARDWNNNIMRYNVSENDGRNRSYGGIHIWGEVKNLWVHNNTIISSPVDGAAPRGIALRPNDKMPQFFPKNVRIFNNIFVASAGVPLVESDRDERSNHFQNNNYYSTDSGPHFIWNGQNHHDLAAWSENTGQERNENKLTAHTADPKFTECPDSRIKFTRTMAYCLRADSPLINKGLNPMSSYQIDFGTQDLLGTGIPVEGFEIGALETAK